MNYTLDVCGNKKIQNPTPSDIQQAVLGLNTKKGDAFLILGPTDTTYIQAGGDQKVGFDVEYQQDDTQHHYRATSAFTSDDVVNIFVSYLNHTEDWKQMTGWEKITW